MTFGWPSDDLRMTSGWDLGMGPHLEDGLLVVAGGRFRVDRAIERAQKLEWIRVIALIKRMRLLFLKQSLFLVKTKS